MNQEKEIKSIDRIKYKLCEYLDFNQIRKWVMNLKTICFNNHDL